MTERERLRKLESEAYNQLGYVLTPEERTAAEKRLLVIRTMLAAKPARNKRGW